MPKEIAFNFFFKMRKVTKNGRKTAKNILEKNVNCERKI